MQSLLLDLFLEEEPLYTRHDYGQRNMVDTTKYKSIAIRIPYYDALVKIGLATLRGPGQQMMVLIKDAATERGIKIKDERIKKSNRRN